MIKMIKRQVVIKMRNNVENIILTHQRPMGLMSPFRNKLNFFAIHDTFRHIHMFHFFSCKLKTHNDLYGSVYHYVCSVIRLKSGLCHITDTLRMFPKNQDPENLIYALRQSSGPSGSEAILIISPTTTYCG